MACFQASPKIQGAEWADQGSSKARVKRKRTAQKPGGGDGFAIGACSGRFPSSDRTPKSTFASREFFYF